MNETKPTAELTIGELIRGLRPSQLWTLLGALAALTVTSFSVGVWVGTHSHTNTTPKRIYTQVPFSRLKAFQETCQEQAQAESEACLIALIEYCKASGMPRALRQDSGPAYIAVTCTE